MALPLPPGGKKPIPLPALYGKKPPLPVAKPPVKKKPLPVVVAPPGQPSLPAPKGISPLAYRPPVLPTRTPHAYPSTLLPYSDEDLYRLASDQATNSIEPERLAITNARAQARKYAEADTKLYTGMGEATSGMLSGVKDEDFKKILAAQVADDTRHRVAQQQDDDAEYERQLVETAAKVPALRDQALSALFDREMQKLSARMNQDQFDESQYQFDVGTAVDQGKTAESAREYDTTFAENARQFGLTYDEGKREFGINTGLSKQQQALEEKKFIEDKRRYGLDYALQQRGVRVQERAQGLAEKSFGLDVAKTSSDIAATNANIQQGWASLNLRNKAQQQDAQAALAKLKALGDEKAMPDSSLSRLRGHFVDAYGHDILDANGKKIPVKVSASQKAAAKKDIRQKVMSEARNMLGDPIEYNGTLPRRGQYVVKKGVKGYGDGTTDDPKKARLDSTTSFAEAQNYIMRAYGLTRAESRSYLIAAGWKPDGMRPKNKPQKGSKPGDGWKNATP